jgi:hypothetical protein
MPAPPGFETACGVKRMTGPLHGLQHGGPLHEAPHGHTSKFIHVIIWGVGSILTYSLYAVKVVPQKKNLGPSASAGRRNHG